MIPRIPIVYGALNPRQARRSGVVLIILGIFLISFTAAIVAFALDFISLTVIFPGVYRDPNAEPASVPIVAWMLLSYFALFGFVSIAAGIWQVRFGERNKYLNRIIIAMGLIFVAAGIIAEGLS